MKQFLVITFGLFALLGIWVAMNPPASSTDADRVVYAVASVVWALESLVVLHLFKEDEK